MVSHLELTFPNAHIGVPEGDVFFHLCKHHCRCCTEICKYFRIHESRDYIFETETISDSI